MTGTAVLKQCPYGVLSNEDMLTVILTVALRITGNVSTAQLTPHSLVFGWGQVLHGSDQRPVIDEHHNQWSSSMAHQIASNTSNMHRIILNPFESYIEATLVG